MLAVCQRACVFCSWVTAWFEVDLFDCCRRCCFEVNTCPDANVGHVVILSTNTLKITFLYKSRSASSTTCSASTSRRLPPTKHPFYTNLAGVGRCASVMG